MVDEFPVAGQVFQYHYLWKWQADQGQQDGRKKRPSCVAVVTIAEDGNRILFIAPITSKEPLRDRAALLIPETEARRAKLDTVIPLWVIVDELNVELLETSFTLENRTAQGAFSVAFTDTIISCLQEIRKTGSLKITKRT